MAPRRLVDPRGVAADRRRQHLADGVGDEVRAGQPGERLDDAARAQQQLPAPGLRRHGDDVRKAESASQARLASPRMCDASCRGRSSRRCRRPRAPVTTSVPPSRNERLLSSPDARRLARRRSRPPSARSRRPLLTSARSARTPASAVTKRMRSAAASARASASSRRRADGEHGTGPVGRAAQRPEDVAGLAVERASRRRRSGPAAPRPTRARRAARRGSASPRRRPRCRESRRDARSAASGRPSAAASASAFRSTPVTSSTSSASWPPPSRAATSITSGPPRLRRSRV